MLNSLFYLSQHFVCNQVTELQNTLQDLYLLASGQFSVERLRLKVSQKFESQSMLSTNHQHKATVKLMLLFSEG